MCKFINYILEVAQNLALNKKHAMDTLCVKIYLVVIE